MPTYDVFGSDPREERARRQMALAQALQAQAFQPIQPETSRLGPAPIHPLQGLAQLLKAYGGRRKEERSQEEMQKLAEERRRELAFALGPQAGIKPNEPATRATRESIAGVLGGSQTPAHQQMALMLRLGAIEGEEERQKALERIMLESQLRPQVAGRDVPYSPEVMAQLAQIREAGRPLTQVSTTVAPKGTEEFVETLGKKQAEKFVEQQQGAQDAVSSLQTIAEGRDIVNRGIIAGAGADIILSIGKLLQQAGVNFSSDAIANTEAFAANQAMEVGRIIKLFGAGTGLSDADREYAARIAGGDIKLTKESILRILDIRERAAINVIKNYNKQASKVEERFPDMFPMGLSVPMPDFPQSGGSKRSPIDDLLNKYR